MSGYITIRKLKKIIKKLSIEKISCLDGLIIEFYQTSGTQVTPIFSNFPRGLKNQFPNSFYEVIMTLITNLRDIKKKIKVQANVSYKYR